MGRTATRKRLEAPQKAVDAHSEAKVGTDSLAELVTPERLQKGDEIRQEETAKAGERRTRVDTQRQLDRYLIRGQIAKVQYDAGIRLYREWQAAGGNNAARIANYDGVRISGKKSAPGPPQSVIAAASIANAIRYVGKQLSGVLVMVCLDDRAAREWAIGRDEVSDSGMVVLRLALDRLAEHYRHQDGGKRRT